MIFSTNKFFYHFALFYKYLVDKMYIHVFVIRCASACVLRVTNKYVFMHLCYNAILLFYLWQMIFSSFSLMLLDLPVEYSASHCTLGFTDAVFVAQTYFLIHNSPCLSRITNQGYRSLLYYLTHICERKKVGATDLGGIWNTN